LSISLVVAVVTVMSVQPTSEKLTVLHCSGSAACAMTGRLSMAANNNEGEPFIWVDSCVFSGGLRRAL